MSIRQIVELSLSALLLVAVTFFLGDYYLSKRKISIQREKIELLTATNAAQVAHGAGLKRIDKQQAAKREVLEKIIVEHKEQMDQPISDDVANQLRHSSGSTEAVP